MYNHVCYIQSKTYLFINIWHLKSNDYNKNPVQCNDLIGCTPEVLAMRFKTGWACMAWVTVPLNTVYPMRLISSMVGVTWMCSVLNRLILMGKDCNLQNESHVLYVYVSFICMRLQISNGSCFVNLSPSILNSIQREMLSQLLCECHV